MSGKHMLVGENKLNIIYNFKKFRGEKPRGALPPLVAGLSDCQSKCTTYLSSFIAIFAVQLLKTNFILHRKH